MPVTQQDVRGPPEESQRFQQDGQLAEGKETGYVRKACPAFRRRLLDDRAGASIPEHSRTPAPGPGWFVRGIETGHDSGMHSSGL